MANPYASPLDVAASMQPIRYGFGQTLTLEDHKVALHDTVPAKGLKRLQRPLMAMLFLGFIWFVIAGVAEPGDPLRDFAWIFIGVAACPFWIGLLGRFGRKRRKRFDRVQRTAQSAKPSYGTITQEYLFDFDQDTAVRCSWDYFGRAFIFPEYLVLSVVIDPHRRIVIPWRNFDSPGEVHQVSQFVKHRLGSVVNQPPTDQQLAAMFQRREEATAHDHQQWPYDDPLQFDKDHWPHASKNDLVQQDPPVDCQVDLSANLSSWRYIGLSSLMVLGYMALAFFPILVATGIWLLANYWSLNGWGFLTEHRWPTTLVLLPIVAVIFLFVRAIFISLSRRRIQQATGLLMRLGENGLHLSGLTFQAWFTHDAVENWILEDGTFGWTLKESGEDVRIPGKCFADPAELERLKKRASQYSSTGTELPDNEPPGD